MSRRLRVVIEGYYEIPDEALEGAYGDPDISAEGIAQIDQANFESNQVSAEEVISWCDQEPIIVTITEAS